MKCDGDTEWTEKLQPAVLAANTQTTKSTSYTPFYLIFGRNFDSSNILNLITSPNGPGMNSQLLTELDTSDEENQNVLIILMIYSKMLTNGLIQYLLLARMIR